MKLLNVLSIVALLFSASTFAVSTKKVENKVKTEITENNEEIKKEVDKLAKKAQEAPAETEEIAIEEDAPDTDQF